VACWPGLQTRIHGVSTGKICKHQQKRRHLIGKTAITWPLGEGIILTTSSYRSLQNDITNGFKWKFIVAISSPETVPITSSVFLASKSQTRRRRNRDWVDLCLLSRRVWILLNVILFYCVWHFCNLSL
jgi:hypothetical protein